MTEGIIKIPDRASAPTVDGSLNQLYTVGGLPYLKDTSDNALRLDGKVLQVVQGTYSTDTSTTSTSYADTGLTATITPSSVDSTILVLVSMQYKSRDRAYGVYLQLLRGATQVAEYIGVGRARTTDTSTYGFDAVAVASWHIPDAPASTSALTYKVQYKSASGSGTAYVNSDNTKSSIVLMEIAA